MLLNLEVMVLIVTALSQSLLTLSRGYFNAVTITAVKFWTHYEFSGEWYQIILLSQVFICVQLFMSPISTDNPDPE